MRFEQRNLTMRSFQVVLGEYLAQHVPMGQFIRDAFSSRFDFR